MIKKKSNESSKNIQSYEDRRIYEPVLFHIQLPEVSFINSAKFTHKLT